MKIDVVVPAVRQDETNRLIRSLSLGSRKPDRVYIVTNEVAVHQSYGLDVRVLGFDSDYYCYGVSDCTLRANIGIFRSDADAIVIQGDHQVASIDMMADFEQGLSEYPYIWGNHRYVDFDALSMEETLALPDTAGESRENPVPHWHQHYSCYGGMFGAKREWLWRFGGFDMAFNCRWGSEDQQFGRRIMVEEHQDGVYIRAHPFTWADRKRPPIPPLKTNSCGEHNLVPVSIEGGRFLRCSKCPYQVPDGNEQLSMTKLMIRFDPSLVRVTETVIE